MSDAAGTTCSVDAQLANLQGCFVVVIAAGHQKCCYVSESLSLAAVDYEDVEEA